MKIVNNIKIDLIKWFEGYDFRSFFTKNICLYIFLFFFFLSNGIWIFFDAFVGGFQFSFFFYISSLYFRFGIDSISFFFIYLTSLLISLCLLYSLNSRTTNKEKGDHVFLLFAVGLLLLCVFYTLDLLVFYISFELILIPFFTYIGVTGYRKRRIHAAYLFFFYTLVGSFFMLISIFIIYSYTGTTDIEILWNIEWIGNIKYVLWVALFLTFGIKVPIFPFHIWLPEAHVEAPTEGSVLLAGLLLKMGTYGFLRFLFPMFMDLNIYFNNLIVTLCMLGIVYTSLTTLRQIDIKRIIAYSSISHMNMCMLGLFSYNEIAMYGSIFLMIAHGIVSAGLFFIIGMIYNRYKTKNIYYISGIINLMPIMCFFFFIFTLGNIGMPGTSNFIGELLILIGIMYQGYYLGIVAAVLGIFFCTVYSMWLYNKIIFLIPKFSYVIITDLYIFEMIVLFPLIIFIFFMGLKPSIFLSLISSSVLLNFFEQFN